MDGRLAVPWPMSVSLLSLSQSVSRPDLMATKTGFLLYIPFNNDYAVVLDAAARA